MVPEEIQALAQGTAVPDEVLERTRDRRELNIRHAILVLVKLSFSDQKGYEWGLTALERKRVDMLLDIAKRGYPLSFKQLEVLVPIVRNHRSQLERLGIALTHEDDIDELRREKREQAEKREKAQPRIDMQEDTVLIGDVYLKDIVADLRLAFDDLRRRTGIAVIARYAGDEHQNWAFAARDSATFPEEAWAIIAKRLPPTQCVLTQAVQVYTSTIAARSYAAEVAVKEDAESKKAAYFTLLATIDDELHGTVGARERTLYRHQRVAVKAALHRGRFICADEVGLGKTLVGLMTAKAFQETHGTKALIITTLSASGMWASEAADVGVNAQVYTWASMPRVASFEDVSELFRYICQPRPIEAMDPFFLVADEAHYAQHLKSARTKYFLALAFHPSCKGVLALTGTPMPNGRPAGTYPLLLACKHPLVHGETPKALHDLKAKYESTFCGKTLKTIAGRRIIDTNGATNLPAWHSFFVYQQAHKENTVSCLIHRKRTDKGPDGNPLVDLPPFYRQTMLAEVSPEAQRIFETSVEAMWKQFEENVAASVQAFIDVHKERTGAEPSESLVEAKESQIRTAQAVVGYNIFRHSAALAKMESALELAKLILDGGNKVVIFSNYLDVVAEISETLGQSGVKTAVIDGATPGKRRDQIVKEFQTKPQGIQCICCTSAAGEAITLNAANYTIIIDRPWKPGDVTQWEGRTYRIGQKADAVTSYWIQMPETVTEVDSKVDGLLAKKALNIAVSLTGVALEEDQRVENNIKANIEKFMYETITRIRSQH